MKAQIFSDLHIDVYPIKAITVAADVDVVIVAGDTCEGVLRAFEHLRRLVPIHIPIVMVLGNHEYYRRFIPDELAVARSNAPAFNIHLLENNAVVLGSRSGVGRPVRFIGATLWTDYCAFGEANLGMVMNACADAMNDHRRIGWQKQPWRRFRPREAALMHHQSKAYIESTLATSFAGASVVVTHHAVHWCSVAPQFCNDHVTGAFVSDLSSLIETYRPELWVHGHVHNSADYCTGGATRVVCNPHGYGNGNPMFDGALTVNIDG